jgi:hypothetical protein
MKSIINYLCVKRSNTFLILLAIVASSVLMSCGSKKEEKVSIPGMMEVDLSSNGLPITINVPDSTKGKLEIEDSKDGTIKLRVGKSFRISVFEDAGDIALKKSDISGDEVKKLKNFIIDEPTTLLYENQITDPEFHIYTIVKVGEKSFVVEDLNGEEMYSQEAAKLMLDAAKSIKAKEKAES